MTIKNTRGRFSHYRSDGTAKVRWPTKAAAEFVAERDSEKHERPHSAYQCPTCKGWHTGRNPSK